MLERKCIAYLYENLLHSDDRRGVELVGCRGAMDLKYQVYEKRYKDRLRANLCDLALFSIMFDVVSW